MHIFSKALIPVPSETITEQLKVLSALGRQELQTGGRSERAELTQLPGQDPRAGVVAHGPTLLRDLPANCTSRTGLQMMLLGLAGPHPVSLSSRCTIVYTEGEDMYSVVLSAFLDCDNSK